MHSDALRARCPRPRAPESVLPRPRPVPTIPPACLAQIGNYDAGAPKTAGRFSATAGWDDAFALRRVDAGQFYASKDSEYPTLGGGRRRITWGWALVGPGQGVQSLPREVTFNAAARRLQQYPIDELKALRKDSAYDVRSVAVSGSVSLPLPEGVARQSEVLVTFALPATRATFGVSVSTDTSPDLLSCTIEYTPAAASVPVSCGRAHEAVTGNLWDRVGDDLTLLPSEKELELRMFLDWTLCETFFQRGRVAMTKPAQLESTAQVRLTSTAPVVADARVWPMRSIWVEPDVVRSAPRVYDW